MVNNSSRATVAWGSSALPTPPPESIVSRCSSGESKSIFDFLDDTSDTKFDIIHAKGLLIIDVALMQMRAAIDAFISYFDGDILLGRAGVIDGSLDLLRMVNYFLFPLQNPVLSSASLHCSCLSFPLLFFWLPFFFLFSSPLINHLQFVLSKGCIAVNNLLCSLLFDFFAGWYPCLHACSIFFIRYSVSSFTCFLLYFLTPSFFILLFYFFFIPRLPLSFINGLSILSSFPFFLSSSLLYSLIYS